MKISDMMAEWYAQWIEVFANILSECVCVQRNKNFIGMRFAIEFTKQGIPIRERERAAGWVYSNRINCLLGSIIAHLVALKLALIPLK